MQVVDGSGRPASRGLRQPLTVKLHESARAGALDLGRVQATVNPPLPTWVDLDPASVPAVTPASGARQASPSPGAKAGLGQTSRRAAGLETGTTTLSASLPVSGPNAAVSFDTFSPVATFGKPDPFEAELDLPGADLSAEELTVRVLPRQADEFTCKSCFLVHHRSQLADEKSMVCTDCAA